MKFSRITIPHGLEIPRVTFFNKALNHKIVIQGAVHVANKSFYENIKNSINDFQGEVHFEGVHKSDTHFDDKMKAMSHSHRFLAHVSGLTMQSEVITKEYATSRPNFHRHDLTTADMKNFLEGDTIKDSLEKLSNIDIESSKTISIVQNLFRSPLIPVFVNFAASKGLSDEDHEIIINKRNQYAIYKALTAKQDVFLFWGSLHLEGMAEILKEAGYEITQTEWEPAISFVNRDVDKESSKTELRIELLKMKATLKAFN